MPYLVRLSSLVSAAGVLAASPTSRGLQLGSVVSHSEALALGRGVARYAWRIRAHGSPLVASPSPG
jgi:hypothetical protein